MADPVNGVAGIVPHMFGQLDFAMFIASLATSAAIGIYFAYFAPKGVNKEADYLFGGRNMGPFPIAFSLVASYISGITLLGMPAEVYVYGYQLVYFNFLYWVVSYLYSEQILPVFHDLQGLSLNEYFMKRFDKKTRIVASCLYSINSITFLPIASYVPALAYEQVTGQSRYNVLPIVCLVCIFYTSLGGIKAVVWTDVIQMFFMLVSALLVAVMGTIDVGGLAVVWERNVATGRIEPPYVDVDPTVRHTIFDVLIGGFLSILVHGCLNQGMIQRHQSLQKLTQAKKAMWIYTTFLSLTIFLAAYSGMVISAYYFHCDPIGIKLARTKDQILPLFVMQTIGHVPGLAGLFIAGIFSAALSSISTILNTLSGIFVEDWIRGCTPWNPTEGQATWIMRIFVLVAGLLNLALIFVVERLGMINQMAASVGAMKDGPTLTIFLLGLFVPWVSPTGVLIGTAVAFATVAPLVIGSQYSISQGLLQFPAKPVSFDSCIGLYNVSAEFMKTVHPPPETLMPMGPTRGDVWYMFRISYLWYTPLSVSCGISAAILTTIFISRVDVRHLDRRLVAPVSRRWLPKDPFDASERGRHVIVPNMDVQAMRERTT